MGRSPAARLARPRLGIILGVVMLATVGCSFTGGTLGGREKCWAADDRRQASVWRGILVIDGPGAQLETPEGDVIPLVAGALQFAVEDDGVGTLVRGTKVVARAGDDVTLFGGIGSGGTLVVCDVEEIHSGP